MDIVCVVFAFLFILNAEQQSKLEEEKKDVEYDNQIHTAFL